MRSDDNGGTQSATILFGGMQRSNIFIWGYPSTKRLRTPVPLKYQFVLDVPSIMCFSILIYHITQS